MATEAQIALPALESVFDRDDAWSRVHAARSWCVISGKSGKTVAVLQGLVTADDWNLRQAVVEALGAVGKVAKDPAVVPLLIPFLDDSERSIRIEAVRALSITGPVAIAAVPSLIRVLQIDAETDVRGRAAYALASIAPRDDEVVAALITALHEDPDCHARWDISHAMERLHKDDMRLEEALIEALAKDDDGHVRFGIAWIFADSLVPPAKAYGILVKMLNDEHFGVRAKAAEALGRMRKKEVIPLLINLLDDRDWYVRWHAIIGLQQFGGLAKAAIPRLEELTHDPAVANAAKSALQVIR
jgi:HEAT repeat protein